MTCDYIYRIVHTARGTAKTVACPKSGTIEKPNGGIYCEDHAAKFDRWMQGDETTMNAIEHIYE